MNEPTGNEDDARLAAGSQPPGRMTLLRDIAVLQVKLVIDGFRDVLLVPASLVAGAISFLARGRQPGPAFYDLLRLGRRSERWINLFGAADRPDGGQAGTGSAAADIDRMVDRVESFVVDEYRHGRLSGQARERLEQALSRLHRAARGDE